MFAAARRGNGGMKREARQIAPTADAAAAGGGCRTEQEIDREARRVLRRLAAPRQVLLARDDGSFAVARGPAGKAASRVTAAAEIVAAFLRHGWIAPDGPGRYTIAELGAAFLARSFGGIDGLADQHRLMQDRQIGAGETARMVRVNAAESPLARLKARELVEPAEFAAGEKLRRDFTLAQLTPRMGVDLSRVVSPGAGTGDNITDIALAARQRFNKALAAAGPGLSDLLFDVCCHLMPLEGAEAARGWAKRSGRVVLRIALARLAAHYGLNVTAQRGAIRAWAAQTEEAV
jgi:hypothetical protein